MARCKDCIHNDVCRYHDKLAKSDEYNWFSYDELENVQDFCKHFKSAANVVPKSEVEKIITERELNRAKSLLAKFLLEDQEARYKSLMAEHDKEVAREIFEEIERTFKALLMGDITDIEKILAELKKKHTESEG